MDWKLELITVPVSDVDRAKAFYTEQLGFGLDVDFAPNPNFRVVQVTPPGSACSIALMRNADAAGSLQGLQVVVADIESAQQHLETHGVTASSPYHFVDGTRVEGVHPQRGRYETFIDFADPDGNGWLLQEVPPA